MVPKVLDLNMVLFFLNYNGKLKEEVSSIRPVLEFELLFYDFENWSFTESESLK